MKWRHAALLAALTACRLGGGPSGNPLQYVAFPDADVDGSAGGNTPPAGDDGTAPAPGDDADATPDEAGPPSDDGASSDPEGGGPGGDDATSEPEGGACSPPMVAVCDPVQNTGCSAPLGQQCDVNPLGSASAPSGQCVFSSGAEAGACLATGVTESCPAKSTCVNGQCQELCFCDGDCPAGHCCSGPSGAPGFKVCGSCP
jgi:hypothetical protein